MELTEVSSIYESEPLEYKEQSYFLNGVCKIRTQLPPLRLLSLLQEVEKEIGRRGKIPKGPRAIDLDILLYGDLVVDEEELKIPHPALHERKFVLLPLVEMCPDFRHPLFGKSLNQLLAELIDDSQVELIGPIDEGPPTKERGG